MTPGPVALAEDALLLLSSGRPAMARTILEGLPLRITAALDQAREAGWTDGYRAAQREGAQLAAEVQELRREAEQQRREIAKLRARTATTSAQPRQPAPPAAAFARTAAEIREHVERLGPERVAEVLAVRLSDLGPLLDGRAGIGRPALDRLRRAQA